MKVIQTFIPNSLRNYNYFIYSDSTREGVFVDPLDLDTTLPIAKEHQVTAKYLINTHYHGDHIRDNKKFMDMEGTEEVKLADGETFKLSDTEYLKAVHTPGHVDDHFCFFLYENEVLVGIISGDTVFNAGVGNCKNGGDPDILFESIRDHFVGLEDDIKIYPSHDYLLTNLKFSLSQEPDNEKVKEWIKRREGMRLDKEFLNTTMGEEKLINPFFRVFQKDFFDKFEFETERELFKYLRKNRDQW